MSDIAELLSEHTLMQVLIKQHLHRAQQRMKRNADKHRSERSFQIGDMVYFKHQPYVQSSVATRAHQKIAFKFFGPLKIIVRLGLSLTSSISHHPQPFTLSLPETGYLSCA